MDVVNKTSRPRWSRRTGRKSDDFGGTPHGIALLTNHGHLLVCLSEDPDARLRDVAGRIGITERAAQRIVTELEEAGMLRRTRLGRRNHYAIRAASRLPHAVEAGHTVGELLAALRPRGAARVSKAARRRPRRTGPAT